MRKVDFGALLILIPYIATGIWVVYGISRGLNFSELFEFIGKDPALFILSSLSIIASVCLFMLGFVEQGEQHKIHTLTEVLVYMCIINLIISIIIASIIKSSLIYGIEFVGDCKFIIMYNLLILLMSLLVNLQTRYSLKKFITKNIGLILLVILLFCYLALRVLVGPNFYLLLISLILLLVIVYRCFGS